MIDRSILALAGAAAFAVLMPLALLLPRGATEAPARAAASVPLVQASAPPLATVYERPLFAGAPSSADEALPADAPALVGVVGRLGQDAVALVKTADGTRTLRIGESVDGWSLASLAIDAAFFTRGTERVRVPLPTDQ